MPWGQRYLDILRGNLVKDLALLLEDARVLCQKVFALHSRACKSGLGVTARGVQAMCRVCLALWVGAGFTAQMETPRRHHDDEDQCAMLPLDQEIETSNDSHRAGDGGGMLSHRGGKPRGTRKRRHL